MKVVRTEKVEIKKTVRSEAVLSFDKMMLSVERYLRVNKDAFDQGLSVNELCGCEVITGGYVQEDHAVLLKNGTIVAVVILED